jgi:hypothetical protein
MKNEKTNRPHFAKWKVPEKVNSLHIGSKEKVEFSFFFNEVSEPACYQESVINSTW